MDWTELELFNGIDLNDSFVLGWQTEDQRLSFDLELSIWPASEYYTSPKDGEYTCYRRAVLVFDQIERYRGLLSMDEAPRSTDASGEIDYGNIDRLVVRGNQYIVEGDFGRVEVQGGGLRLEFNT
ncbi:MULTISPECIES: hypothetical protein [unclassified Halomonas]|uniref:hypothetical protein n=1 Tax=unclassified Halomonas TaxID=2609666 RepID=UPI001CF39EA8|nr:MULTISPECIES: hypothetical protein [unclassified Halomonas]UZH09801.1 hypothetical protein OM794_21120 [Halomonas sp. BDJS001]